MFIRIKKFILKYKLAITASLSFLIPLIMYLLTLEHKVVGGDTTWYAIQLPEMQVMVPTGYPTFSLIGKLMSMIPVGDLAYRLNLISAIFGSLTVLFLFLAVNKLTKNEIISLAGSLSFAFVLTFWSLSVRLEFDTLNSFFITLIIFTAFLFNESKLRRHLYFYFFCLGLSLTNHPIALFVMPAFLLYIIIINPRIFKSFKVISLSILFFILPLLLYAYIPIRSLQGYGTANTLKEFLYYITGRTTTGKTFGGSFGNNSIQVVLQVFKDFILIIYKNFGIIFIIVAIVGFIYLIKKNWKFAISSLFVPILSMAIVSQYLGWSPENYTIDSMIIISFYISFGFLLIFDMFSLLFNKLEKMKKTPREDISRQKSIMVEVSTKEIFPNKETKTETIKLILSRRNRFIKYLAITLIFIFFISQPTLLAFTNYKKADLSKPEGIYLFWDSAFKNIEKNSLVYIFTRSANIGAFINLYEQKSKGTKFITNNDPEYTINNMKENLKNGKTIYFIGTDTKLKQYFFVQQIGEGYFWPRYKENLIFYKIIAEFNFNIEYVIDSKIKKFGDKFNLEYIVKNDSDIDIKITSFELSLPNNIMFLNVVDKGYIKQGPGLSKGKYIWVSDSYIIKPHSSINLILELRGKSTGKSIIKFRLTTQGIYFESNDLEIEITN
jgi:hypothetical protein